MPAANTSNISTIQILRSYSNSAPLTLDDGQLAYSFVSNTLFIGSNTGIKVVSNPPTDVRSQAAYNQANTATVLANAAYFHANGAFLKANAAFNNSNTKLSLSGGTITGPISGSGETKLDFTTYGPNTAYLTTTNDDSTALFMGAGSAELYADTSVQIRTNTKGTSKAWTFDGSGTLTFPDNTIQTTAYVPNDEVDNVARAAVNAAYFHANGAFLKANAAFIQANLTIGVDASQNVRLAFSNTRMDISDGVNISQNVRLDFSNTRMTIIEGVDVGQNARMAIIESTDVSQNVRLDFSNTRMTIIDGVNASQNVRLDFSNTRMNIIDGVDAGQNSRMTIADGVDASQNVRIDYSNTAITIIQGVDTSQNARMVIIEGTDVSQNVRLNFSNTRMDISDGVNVSQNVRLDFSNTALTISQGVDDSQNVRLDFSNTAITIIQGVDVGQNNRMSISDGVNASQNVRLDFSNAAITIIQGVDVTQNTRLAVIEGTDLSQNVRLDFSNTRMNIIDGVDAGQNSRMTIIEGTDASQNARMAIIEGTNASQNVRLDFSNAAITIIQGVDVTQNTRLTVSEGVDLSQNVRLDFSNTRMNIIDGVDAGQNARMTIIEGVDVTQNTNIANRLALSGASLQTVTGNVVFGNDLTVTGNLVVLGNTISLNVTSFEVEDTLIQLGIGNYYTDALTIGYVGHYNDGTNAHAGMIRDALTKEFYAFQGYTPEVSGNVINVNAASFTKANIHGNWFKGNLIATTARVGGLDVNSRLDFSNTRMTIIEGVDVTQNTNIAATDGKMQSAYNVANTADVRSVAAYFHANGAFIKANAAFDSVNVQIGVDNTQNTRMSVIEGTDLSQNVSINTQNSFITIIQGVDVGQNSRMLVIEGTDTSQNVRLDFSNTRMTIIEGVDVTQNTRLSVAEGTDLSQNVRLDFSNTRMNIIDGVDVGQNNRMTIIEGVDVTQNTRLTVSEGVDLSQNVSINTQNSFITIIQGVDVGQNNRMAIIEGTDTSQNVRIDYSNTALTIAQGVDNSQNVRIDYSNTAINQIQSAWIANTVIVANSAGFLSNSVMRFDASNSQLHSMANLSIGTSVASAPLTLSKTFLLPTAAEQFGQLNSVAYNVADINLKQGLRLNTVAQHTSGNITNLVSLLNLSTAGGVGGTTDSQYGFWARNDVSAGAFATNSYNYFSNNSGGLAGPSNQYGFYTANLTKGLLSNYGFYGAVNTGNNAFNLYMAGTAPNYLAGSLTVANNVPSTSNTTGTLVVTGGLGVSGNIYVGGTNAGANGIYTDNLRYAANGLPWVMNAGGGGYLANTIIVANSTGYLSNSNAFFTSSNNAVLISANTLFGGTASFTEFGNIQRNRFNITPTGSGTTLNHNDNTPLSIQVDAKTALVFPYIAPLVVNYLQISGNTTGNAVTISTNGSDTNVSMNVVTKGSGSILFNTQNGQTRVDGGSNTQFAITNTANAVNYIQVAGNTTGGSPILSGQGSDTNVGINITPKGNGSANITSTANSTSNTSGALVVTGGIGVTGNVFLSSANNFATTTTQASYRLGWSDSYFMREISNGNMVYTGPYFYINSAAYVSGILYTRGTIANDSGNTTVLFAGSSQVKIQNGTGSSNTTTGALVVQGGVGISGALNATTKSFNIPHPTKEGKDLRYGSLEGPEFGVYVRGTLKGSNIIELPDYWTKLVDANTITVSLTPIGKYQKLSVKEIKDNTIIINSDGWFRKEIHCYYVVYGERADVDKLDVEG
jgi:hypothetical protein